MADKIGPRPWRLGTYDTSMSTSARLLPTDSLECERWWLPILGPTSVALARLAMSLPGEIEDPGPWVGVKTSHLHHTADRLVHHKWAVIDDDGVTLRVATYQFMPTREQADRLPEVMRLTLMAAFR